MGKTTNDLTLALAARKNIILDLAKEGFPAFIISLYFQVHPNYVKNFLKKNNIEELNIVNKDDINSLFSYKDRIVEENENLTSYGFFKREPLCKKDELGKNMYLSFWKQADIIRYFEEIENKKITTYYIKNIFWKEKDTWTRDLNMISDLIINGYNSYEICEYFSVSEHMMTDIRKTCLKGLTNETSLKPYSFKSKERREQVYKMRVLQKMPENMIAEKLHISRATVHDDLKYFFEEYPELQDEYCKSGRKRRCSNFYKEG